VFILCALLIAAFIKHLLFKEKIFSKSHNTNSTKSKCDSCRNKSIINHSLQQNQSAHNHNYQIPLTYEDGKTNGLKRNSQMYFEQDNRPLSFGGSVGLKYSFSGGNKSLHPLNLEMKTFANEIISMLTSNPPTFDDWYHRKSGSIVLAVCQWKKEISSKITKENDGELSNEFIYTKGINVEVSIATGSICAERVAIAQAHTSYPDLNGKQNLTAVAVLQLSTDLNDPNKDENPKLPCGMCQIWLEKLASKDFHVIAYPDRNFSQFIEFYRPRLIS
jgi:cytidine deaminase